MGIAEKNVYSLVFQTHIFVASLEKKMAYFAASEILAIIKKGKNEYSVQTWKIIHFHCYEWCVNTDSKY